MQATEDIPRLPMPIPPNTILSLGGTAPARWPRTELGTIMGAAASAPARATNCRRETDPLLSLIYSSPEQPYVISLMDVADGNALKSAAVDRAARCEKQNACGDQRQQAEADESGDVREPRHHPARSQAEQHAAETRAHAGQPPNRPQRVLGIYVRRKCQHVRETPRVAEGSDGNQGDGNPGVRRQHSRYRAGHEQRKYHKRDLARSEQAHAAAQQECRKRPTGEVAYVCRS